MNNKEKREQMMKNLDEFYAMGGMNCAEIVFLSYVHNEDFPLQKEVVCLASGMGSGLSFEKNNTCGALLGANLAIGCNLGRKNPIELSSKEERGMQLAKNANVFKNLTKEFSEEFTSSICCDMCNLFDNKEDISKNCHKAIVFSAKKASEIIYPD